MSPTSTCRISPNNCDIGTPRSQLTSRWPHFDFGELPERWWPEPEESEHQLLARCTEFRGAMAVAVDWRHVAVVTHWGFIRGLTGQGVANGTVLTFDPTADATAETEDQMPR